MIFANKNKAQQQQNQNQPQQQQQQSNMTTTQAPKPKTGKEIIVRIRGKDGNFRYEVDPNERVVEIKKLLQADTSVPPEVQTLSLDPNKGPAIPDNITLTAANIKHGAMLYLRYDVNNVKSKQDIEDEKKRELLKKELGDMDDLSNLGLKYRSKYWTVESYGQLVEQYKIRIKHQVCVYGIACMCH
jgi:hypothetical protein